MNNLNELIPILLIALTCGISAWGLNNSLIFQRYQFHIGEIRYNKQYRRLITSAFLHADFMHLFFNMFTLYFFSRVIVLVYGVWLFLALYFGSVLAGNLFSLWLYKNRPSYAAIGASGGVSGILFAAIALAPLQTIYLYFIPVTAWIFATLYFAYSVTMMLKPQQWDNTGHAAHLGGAAFGMLFAAALTWQFMLHNALFIGIMSLPLLYLAYEILINKRGR